VIEEVSRGGAGEAVDEAGRGIEEPEHGVEVTVGAPTRRAAREGGVAPRLGQAARRPHPPQDDLDPVPLAQGVDRGGQHPVHPACGLALRADVVEGARREHGFGEQHVTRSATAAVELESPQRAAQPPQRHGIRPTDRGGERVDDLRGIEVLTTGDHLQRPGQQGEERPHGGLVGHGEVSGGRVDRHAGTAQHAAQGGRAGPAAHDDGHA
jgi:hypothetical protein